MSKVDDLRLGMMGVGKLDSERTERQRRLRTIIMCAPIRRRFKPEQIELWSAQERYLDKRTHFVTARTHDQLIELGRELLDLDARLSAAQYTDDLAELEP